MMNEYLAVSLLYEVNEVFRKNGLEYWLDAGTLLGAVRDGKFIPWDNDIDLGTWKKNKPKLFTISQDLQEMGFFCIFEDYVFSAEKKGIKIDIFLYDFVYGKAIYILPVKRNLIACYLDSLHCRIIKPPKTISLKNKEIPKLTAILMKVFYALPSKTLQQLDYLCLLLYNKIGIKEFVYKIGAFYFDRLDKISFYGLQLNIPSSIEKYLTIRYGKNWRTPDKKWTYYKDIPLLASEIEFKKLQYH